MDTADSERDHSYTADVVANGVYARAWLWVAKSAASVSGHHRSEPLRLIAQFALRNVQHKQATSNGGI